MLNELFFRWCLQLQQHSQAKRWRNLVVLVGDDSWTGQQLETSLTSLLCQPKASAACKKQGLIYGEINNLPHSEQLVSVNGKNYPQYLGTEQNVIVFALTEHRHVTGISESDFDVDAFAALSGTIVSGGSLILLLKPSLVAQLNNGQSKDYFFQRFIRQIVAAQNCYVLRQDENKLPLFLPSAQSLATNAHSHSSLTRTNTMTMPYGCITQEQALAVEAMLKVLSGHRDRPLVLTADRGRGKSTALALAACQMLDNAQQPLKIIVTAASKQALTIFFQQVKQHLPAAIVKAAYVGHPNGSINFYPIDVLLKEQPQANIIMVDEAAAIPVYLLQQLLRFYHRLIFASTIHGYEGAGRGFSIKFRQVLQQVMPNWRNMHINEAIRWASDDPLERFVFDSCLLNAKLPSFKPLTIVNSGTANTIASDTAATIVKSQYDAVVELVTTTQLLQNEALLKQVFAVLVTAHYQTSPSDVKLLLNNTAISLFVLKRKAEILGVAMLMQEGQVNAKTVALVSENQRRLRDQFLPQSLLTHCGIKQSFEYRYQRVMRIAIHPQIQGQGLGSHFLTSIEQHIAQQNNDFIGASFAGNARLVKFWQQAGFTVARVGFSKDKASGEHSCLVTKPLTAQAQRVQKIIAQQFYQQFDYWLTDEFKQMSAKLVWQLLNGDSALKNSTISYDVLQTVDDFTSGQRQFSSCVFALHHWLIKHCTAQFDGDVLPLIARILQKHSIEQVCLHYGFTGKKALNQHLINYIDYHKNKVP